MDSIIWMDDDVIMQPASAEGLYITYRNDYNIRVNLHIKTLDDLADWLYLSGYGLNHDKE